MSLNETGSESAPATRVGAGVLTVTCVSALVVNANTSAVTILLPAIGHDVGATTTTLQWAVTGYSLVGAAVIVTGGVLGDIAGRRRIFTAALALFVASCALIGLSGTAVGVIAGRAIQGAAGSTLLACGLSLLSVAATGRAQVRAVSLWGAASAVGAAAGPLVGGALVDSTGWSGLFWIDAAIAAVCVPVTLRSVPESRDENRPRSLDLTGTLLVAIALMLFMLALTEGPAWGWGAPATFGCFAGTAAAGIGFWLVERRVSAPLVDLRLLRNRVLVGATVSILLVAGAINGLMYVLSLYFQDPAGLALSPLKAGLATLPAAAGIVLVAPLVSGLAARVGTRRAVALGFAVTTAGFVVLAFLHRSWSYGLFVWPLLATAVGMGLVNGCASAAATASVPASQVGAASGISNMARYVGAALLTAASATIYAGAQQAGAPVAGVARCAVLMAITALVGTGIAVLYGRFRHRGRASWSSAHTVPSAESSAESVAGTK